MQFDSYSIKQIFDEEKQDLAIFHAKANKCLLKTCKILLRNVVNTGSYTHHGKNYVKPNQPTTF